MHYRRTIIWLLALLIVFAAIFLLAFIGLQKNQSVFNLGFAAQLEDWLIMVLCTGSIVKIVWELYSMRHALPKQNL